MRSSARTVTSRVPVPSLCIVITILFFVIQAFYTANIVTELMKEDWFFWRRWAKREKIPFFLGVFLVAGLVAWALWGWVCGLETVFSWDTVTELKEKAVQTPALYLDQFSFSATTPLWYVTE